MYLEIFRAVYKNLFLTKKKGKRKISKNLEYSLVNGEKTN